MTRPEMGLSTKYVGGFDHIPKGIGHGGGVPSPSYFVQKASNLQERDGFPNGMDGPTH